MGRRVTLPRLSNLFVMSSNNAFKALADPTRREILRLLAKGELTAGDLSERFDMSKPSVSHHFSVLKDADLIRSRRDGQKIIYSLNTTVAQDLLTWLWDLFGKPSSKNGEKK
jgi:ArsR family transcriptional regulator